MTLVRRKNAEIKMQVMDQRRKNRKQGLDPDDLPDDLADQQEQLGQLRDELRTTNQRLVDSIIVIGVSAASRGIGGRVQEREGQGQRPVVHGREPQVHADGGTDRRTAPGNNPRP